MADEKLLKKDIIRELSKYSGLTQVDAEKFLDAFHTMLLNCASRGIRVQDVGYFDMTIERLPERKACIPNYKGTGKKEIVTVPSANRVAFKTGKLLKGISNHPVVDLEG